jgi:hypothetical protein
VSNYPLKKMRILASTLALALPGCFDIENKIVLGKDTFSADIAFRFPKELLTIGNEGEKDSDICEDFQKLKMTQVQNLKLESKVEVSDMHITCRLTVQGPLDYDLLAEKGSIDKLNSKSSSEKSAEELFANGVVFKKIGANKMRMTRTLKFDEGDLKRRGSLDLQMGSRVADMREEDVMKLIFAGGTFRQIFEAEKIYASNGEFLVKDKIVEWKLPLTVALSTNKELWVEFAIPRPWYKRMWNIFE